MPREKETLQAAQATNRDEALPGKVRARQISLAQALEQFP